MKKMLIVDDSRTMRMIIKRTLRLVGLDSNLEIHEAASAEEALEQFGKIKPEIVLSDWNMPGLSGLDLLKAVRGQGEAGNVTFGFITSQGTDEMMERAREAGANFYLTKPFNDQSFEHAVAPFVR